MKLQLSKRTGDKKSEVKQLRREGLIPGIVYSKGEASRNTAVQASEFKAALRNLIPGRLSTTVFTLVDEDGKEIKAIVKDIQYKVTNYDILHLDFEELVPKTKINVKVPIECIGQMECVGIKLGGVLRQVIRYARISCFPDDMPAFFELDVRDLSMRQYKKLSDLQLPETLKALDDPKQVVAVIVKR